MYLVSNRDYFLTELSYITFFLSVIHFVLMFTFRIVLRYLLPPILMVFFLSFVLQDLQSEIETHRVVYDRLDGTGRKLLGSLTSQEDAVMLQRRLDEMNHRWNHLKSKSIAIRCV